MLCHVVPQLATSAREGGLSPITRFWLKHHLAGCERCRRAVSELEMVSQALREAAHAEGGSGVSAASKAQALQAFRAFHAEGQASLAPAPRELDLPLVPERAAALPNFAPAMIVVGLAATLGGLGARHYAQAAGRYLSATALAALAVGLVALAKRRGLLSAALATGSAALLGVASAHGSGIPDGTACAVHELITAGLASSALVLARGNALLTRSMLVGVAGAGALAGAATLHVTCPGAESLGHVLVFHVGGVVIAAALLGSLAARILGPSRVRA